MFIALFVFGGIAYIISAPLENIHEGLRLILGIAIFIFVYIKFFKLIFSFDYLPTKWYVRNSFDIELEKNECKYLSCVFSGNRWYPLKELNSVSANQRKEALFSIAKNILQYAYDPVMFEKKKKPLKLNKPGFLKKPPSASAADELRKYNELLKEGAMTQEEYDKIKTKILGSTLGG
jgi:hypothetical protein